MATARVLAQGQVTLPSEIRHAAGIKPGDVLEIEVVGPGQVRLVVLPRPAPPETRDGGHAEAIADPGR
ncbi:MAG: AbrB/MazE/SpoVT family DNA-binding domain-containing protein [Chloroflexota bacterium]